MKDEVLGDLKGGLAVIAVGVVVREGLQSFFSIEKDKGIPLF